MNQEQQILQNLNKDLKYFYDNYDSLIEKNENKFIAIEKEQIVSINENLEELIAELKKKGKNPALLLIKFIHKKGMTIIY